MATLQKDLSPFVRNLADFLERNGISRKAFAERVGINVSTLSQVFGGRQEPSASTRERIRQAYPDEWPRLIGEVVPERPSFREMQAPPVPTPAAHEPVPPYHPERKRDTLPPSPAPSAPPLPQGAAITPGKAIARIVIFYRDGTFANYTPAPPSEEE